MSIKPEQIIDVKYDQISENLEKLVLDALICVLAKLNERHDLLIKSIEDEDFVF